MPQPILQFDNGTLVLSDIGAEPLAGIDADIPWVADDRNAQWRCDAIRLAANLSLPRGELAGGGAWWTAASGTLPAGGALARRV